MIAILLLTFLYLGSIVGSWCAARWMEKKESKKYNRPTDMPILLALFFTFCPMVNTIVMIMGTVIYLSEGLSATNFYRLDKD